MAGEIGYIDDDATMAGNSPHAVPSQKAMKTAMALKADTATMTTALGDKVDKITGKGLSKNDYTDAEKTTAANQSGTNTGDQSLAALATTASMTAALAGKEPTITAGTIKDFYRGDKSWQRLKIQLPYTVTTTSGSAIVYLTNNGLVGGTALFASIDYIHLDFTSNNPNFGKSYTISGDLKTLTITAVTQSFAGITLLSTPILGSVSVVAAVNGTQLSVLVMGTPV